MKSLQRYPFCRTAPGKQGNIPSPLTVFSYGEVIVMHGDPVAGIDHTSSAAPVQKQGKCLQSSDHMVDPGTGCPQDIDLFKSPVRGSHRGNLKICIILLPVIFPHLYTGVFLPESCCRLFPGRIEITYDQVRQDIMPCQKIKSPVGSDEITVFLNKREGKVIIDLAPCDNHSSVFHCHFSPRYASSAL